MHKFENFSLIDELITKQPKTQKRENLFEILINNVLLIVNISFYASHPLQKFLTVIIIFREMSLNYVLRVKEFWFLCMYYKFDLFQLEF